jgi:hypothetical protein
MGEMVKNQANPESRKLSVDNCVENQVVIPEKIILHQKNNRIPQKKERGVVINSIINEIIKLSIKKTETALTSNLSQ